MTLKSDSKFEEKLTCGLENDPKKLSFSLQFGQEQNIPGLSFERRAY